MTASRAVWTKFEVAKGMRQIVWGRPESGGAPVNVAPKVVREKLQARCTALRMHKCVPDVLVSFQ